MILGDTWWGFFLAKCHTKWVDYQCVIRLVILGDTLFHTFYVEIRSLLVRLVILSRTTKRSFYGTKKAVTCCNCLICKVVPPGIEPGTQGFSVLCSTNWAMAPCVIAGAKIDIFFNTAISAWFFCKKFSRFFAFLIFWFTFVPAIDRNVAQLVAHYVRDVGVGRSSRLIPTYKVWFSMN